MSKHTPGPWVVVGSRTKYVEARLVGSLMQEVAACGPTLADEGYGQQQEANARLIAAAPDLLEALQELCEIVEDAIEQKSAKDLDSFTLQPARAAIAKATGEQP